MQIPFADSDFFLLALIRSEDPSTPSKGIAGDLEADLVLPSEPSPVPPIPTPVANGPSRNMPLLTDSNNRSLGDPTAEVPAPVSQGAEHVMQCFAANDQASEHIEPKWDNFRVHLARWGLDTGETRHYGSKSFRAYRSLIQFHPDLIKRGAVGGRVNDAVLLSEILIKMDTSGQQAAFALSTAVYHLCLEHSESQTVPNCFTVQVFFK